MAPAPVHLCFPRRLVPSKRFVRHPHLDCNALRQNFSRDVDLRVSLFFSVVSYFTHPPSHSLSYLFIQPHSSGPHRTRGWHVRRARIPSHSARSAMVQPPLPHHPCWTRLHHPHLGASRIAPTVADVFTRVLFWLSVLPLLFFVLPPSDYSLPPSDYSLSLSALFCFLLCRSAIYGSFQSYARTCFSELVPSAQAARWFGLYSITDKLSHTLPTSEPNT